jgi:hypothetical protein
MACEEMVDREAGMSALEMGIGRRRKNPVEMHVGNERLYRPCGANAWRKARAPGAPGGCCHTRAYLILAQFFHGHWEIYLPRNRVSEDVVRLCNLVKFGIYFMARDVRMMRLA